MAHAFTCLDTRELEAPAMDGMLVRHFGVGYLLATMGVSLSRAVGFWAGVWFTVGWAAWYRDGSAQRAEAAHALAPAVFLCGVGCARAARAAAGLLAPASFPPPPPSPPAPPVRGDAAAVAVFGGTLAAVVSFAGYLHRGCGGLPEEVARGVGAAAALAVILACVALVVAARGGRVAHPLRACVLLAGLGAHAAPCRAALWPAACGAYWVAAWAGAAAGGDAAVLTAVDAPGGDALENGHAVLLAASALLLLATSVELAAGCWRRRARWAKPAAPRPSPEPARAGARGGAARPLGGWRGAGLTPATIALLALACTAVAAAPPPPPGADLVPDGEELRRSVRVQHGFTSTDACLVSEGCLAAGTLGTPRTLLRFSTRVWNVGTADLLVGKPPARGGEGGGGGGGGAHPRVAPNGTWWDWHACHGHWHLAGFARARLLHGAEGGGAGGAPVQGARALKVSFCLRDDACVRGADARAVGEDAARAWRGRRKYDCERQGISAGCSDVYDLDLPCQWIDVTDVAPGVYVLELTANPDALFAERTTANNVARVEVDLRVGGAAPPTYATRATRVAAWATFAAAAAAHLALRGWRGGAGQEE